MHFFRISCILPFFYPNFSSNFAPQFKIIARSSHVHRVVIAHTYTCSRYEPCGRSSSAKEQARSLRRSKHKQRAELYFSTGYALLNNEQALLFFILDNEKFCLILKNRPKAVVLYKKPKQVYLVLFILFTPARFIPNPLVPAPRSYLSGGHERD